METLPESNAKWCSRSSRLDDELAAFQGRCRVRCVECFGSGWVGGVAYRCWYIVRCAMIMVWTSVGGREDGSIGLRQMMVRWLTMVSKTSVIDSQSMMRSALLCRRIAMTGGLLYNVDIDKS